MLGDHFKDVAGHCHINHSDSKSGRLMPWSGYGSSKSRTPQNPWLSGHRPDSLSAMRKMLILLRVALLHRLDRALAISYFESLAVRRQLAVLNRKTPRPRLHPSDRWFWVLISSFWPDWRDALAIVKPATVIGWTEARSRLKQAETPRPVSSRSTAPAKKNPKRPQIAASRRKVQEMQRIRIFGNDNRPFLLC